MKKLPLLLLIFGAITMGPSCASKSGLDFQDQDTRDLQNEYAIGLTDMWPEEDGCILKTYDLVGGGNTTLGTVQVITYYGRAFVKYEVNEGFLIKGTHVFVGDAKDDLPIGMLGRPKISHFPYKWGHVKGSGIVVQQADLEGINSNFEIAAHALIYSADGEMSAWAWDSDAISIAAEVSESKRGWYVNYSAAGCYASLL